MNASTFAARVCAATLADMHSAVVAALGTLQGPAARRGKRAGDARAGGHQAGRRRPAGGCQPTGQPAAGATARRSWASGTGSTRPRTRGPPTCAGCRRNWPPRAVTTRITACRAGWRRSCSREKGLYPNVDFFAATVYHYLGIPTDLFTPVFSASRMAGWTAHVIEQHADNRLIRPDSEYIGESGLQLGAARCPVKHAAKPMTRQSASQQSASGQPGEPRRRRSAGYHQLPYWVVLAGMRRARDNAWQCAGGQGRYVGNSGCAAGGRRWPGWCCRSGRAGMLGSRRRLADVAALAALGVGLLIAGLVARCRADELPGQTPVWPSAGTGLVSARSGYAVATTPAR